jgi:hypothetical protein
VEELAQLDLKVVTAKGLPDNETRFELRIASNNDFVAWFRSQVKSSNGELIKSTTTQFVRRRSLSREQIRATVKWLRTNNAASI